MVFGNLNPLHGHHFVALPRGLLPQGHILYQLTLLSTRFNPGMQISANSLCKAAPRKTKYQRRANNCEGNRDQARTRKTQPFNACGSQYGTEHAPTVAG